MRLLCITLITNKVVRLLSNLCLPKRVMHCSFYCNSSIICAREKILLWFQEPFEAFQWYIVFKNKVFKTVKILIVAFISMHANSLRTLHILYQSKTWRKIYQICKDFTESEGKRNISPSFPVLLYTFSPLQSTFWSKYPVLLNNAWNDQFFSDFQRKVHFNQHVQHLLPLSVNKCLTDNGWPQNGTHCYYFWTFALVFLLLYYTS